MGFLAAQYFFAHQPEGLPTAQICIMSRASWSCRDDTAFLDRPKEWLALKCAVKPRSLERHLPQLAKLELLVWNGNGFRLPRFYEFNRQIGGQVRQIVRQNVRQIGGAYKEGMYGNVCEETPPLVSPPGRERKLARRERKEKENLEALITLRSRPRPHWPAGLDRAWAEYGLVDCLMCGRLLTCKDRECQTDHEHNHAWMCDDCMVAARTKLRSAQVKA